jgi:hypothetical protein
MCERIERKAGAVGTSIGLMPREDDLDLKDMHPVPRLMSGSLCGSSPPPGKPNFRISIIVSNSSAAEYRNG